MWKAAALGVAAALLGLLLQKAEPAHTLLLGLAAAGAVLTLTLELFRELRDVFGDLCREAGLSPGYNNGRRGRLTAPRS